MHLIQAKVGASARNHGNSQHVKMGNTTKSRQSTRTSSSRLRNSSFHASAGPEPEVQEDEKMPLEMTSWVISLCKPLFLTASSKTLTIDSGISLMSADTASDSSFPILKAFAIPVACDHSWQDTRMHAVLLVTVSSDLAQNFSMGLKGADFVWKVRTEFSVGQVQNLVQSV